MPTKKTTKKTTNKKVAKKVNKKVVKKATKKKVAKKATKKSTKKAASKKKSKPGLVYASDDKSFWVSDGRVLNSLLALQDALSGMSAPVYNFHIGGDSNDFADWVEAVLGDEKCAKDLRKAKTKTSAKIVVVKHLKNYAV